MKRNNKRGFTIVELVIVIAVIAILTAVLIPTFTSATEKAKQSAALQEAKQELTLYVAENNGIVEGNYLIKSSDYFFVVKDGAIEDTTANVKDEPVGYQSVDLTEATIKSFTKVTDVDAPTFTGSAYTDPNCETTHSGDYTDGHTYYYIEAVTIQGQNPAVKIYAKKAA